MIDGYVVQGLSERVVGNHWRRQVASPAIMAQSVKNVNGNPRIILWFRNDLRIHDNVIVDEAVKRIRGGQAVEVLPVFCFDARWFRQSSYGNGMLKTGDYRAQFVLESVQNLKEKLRSVGSDLVVAMDAPENVLAKLTGDGASVVFAQKEVTSEEVRAELAVSRSLKQVKSRLELFWGSTLYHIDDVPFERDMSTMPSVFTPFRQKVEDKAEVRRCFDSPVAGSLPFPSNLNTLIVPDVDYVPRRVEDINVIVPKGDPCLQTPQVDDRAAFKMKGGEDQALERLNYYLWESKLIEKYFEIRNGMVGSDYSTKLAPALAHGCISPRRIYWDIKKYEKENIANKSTYWVIFELIWRDYFKFYAMKEGDAIFNLKGPIQKSRPWKKDAALFEKWRTGQTGWPLVDANMRELLATGFMSNRGRQNVASFAALDLGLDWRMCADHFESLLVDYDPASNWGNWVAAAGLTGGRINRFNITKQSKDYDPDGEYIRLWCSELKNVPATKIHEPWLMSKKDQELFGVQIGSSYPQAIPSSTFVSSSGGNRAPSRFGPGPKKPQGPKNKRGNNNRQRGTSARAFDPYEY